VRWTTFWNCRTALAAWVVTAASLLTLAAPSQAALHSDRLLPNTTKGLLVVPEMSKLIAAWNETQLGQLMNDPVMKPFTDDLKQQIRDKLTMTDEKLGISWDDVRGILGGEMSVAVVQTAPATEAILVVLADVTGHNDEARAALAKADADLLKRGAKKITEKVGNATLTIYTLPPKPGEKHSRQAIYFLEDNTLAACDDKQVLAGVLGRMTGQHQDALAAVAAYQAINARVDKEIGDLAPDARWFVEPFGFTESIQLANAGGKLKRGKKLLPVLQNQGFDAIQGVGGVVNMKHNQYELLHRTFVYAPGIDGQTGSAAKRFRLAARALEFPNGGQLEPQPFIPRDVATYGSFNVDIAGGFSYIGTLVDEVIDGAACRKPGYKSSFQEILQDIKNDKEGPQIDLVKNLIGQLGNRVSVVASVHEPIGPESERLVVLIEAKDEAASRILERTVEKAMIIDPEVRKRTYKGHVIWEAVPQAAELPTVHIDDGGSGLLNIDDDPLDKKEDDAEQDVERAERMMPRSAITVANGHLMIASHIDALTRLLDEPLPTDQLRNGLAYRRVTQEMDQLVGDVRSFRFFSHTDEEYKVNYELMRTGRMAESKTLVGQMLNRLLGDDKAAKPREQKINAGNLPPYDSVRRYLGPAGMSVTTEDAGWFLTGFTLSKQDPHPAVAEK